MKKVSSVLAAVALGLMASGSYAANSLTYQGVTFESRAVDADTLEFSILNATSATGNWSGASFLKAFQIDLKESQLAGAGAYEVTSASFVSGPGVFTTNTQNGLAANNLGCNTGGTPGACFSFASPLALTNSMVWTIDFSAKGAWNFDAPHLKIQFMDEATSTKNMGSVLSQTLPVSAVPEPETYAMLLAGLGLMATVARKRKAA